MKPTSLFLAFGLAICQLVAAAPKGKSSNDVHVQWWTLPNFKGEDGEDGVNPGSCESLQQKYVNQIQSIQVESGGSCNFYIADRCVGPSILLTGLNPALPPPYAGNTSSYDAVF